MKLLMAISADGFVARGPDDDMRWLGPTDKGVFKLLTTQTDPSILVRSRRTELAMPRVLNARKIISVTRKHGGVSLEKAHANWPDAWMVGGQELATVAIKAGMIGTAFLCHSPRYCFDGIPSTLQESLNDVGLKVVLESQVGEVRVVRYGR